MSFLRACLFSTTALIAGAVLTQSGAQPSSGAGDAVISAARRHHHRPDQPAALPHRAGARPLHPRLRRRYPWRLGGCALLAAQGQNSTAKRLLEWRYALDRNSGATFAEIDAVIRGTESKGPGAWPLRGTLQARAETAMPPDMAAERYRGLVQRQNTQFQHRQYPPGRSFGGDGRHRARRGPDPHRLDRGQLRYRNRTSDRLEGCRPSDAGKRPRPSEQSAVAR